jgi:hypothetical protein
MSQAPIATPPSLSHRQPQALRASRPTVLDYLLILVGWSFSLVLTDWSGLRATAQEETPAAVSEHLLKHLPDLLFLPVGVILLWPIFYLTQRVVGRPAALAPAEWLWGLAWLGALALTGWVAWQHWGTPPEFLSRANFKEYVLVGYAVAMISLAVIAMLIWLVDLIGRWPQPWTHSLGVVLLVWPVLPLLAVMIWKIKIN